MKTCTRCNISKSVDEFSPRQGGYASRCRACCLAVYHERYEPTPGSQRRKSDWETRTKVCSKCEVRKSFDDYSKRAGRKDYQSYCKACDAIYQRTKRLGITNDEFLAIMAQQADACGACGDLLRMGTGQYAVDHCHKTGRVRGVLCGNCNLALGHLKDDPRRILALVEYLDAAA